MKKLVTSYTFDASAKTIVSTDFTSLEKIQLITNVATNAIIYNFADPAKGGSLSSTTLTLVFDTTSMSDTDELQIFVHDDALAQPITASSLPLPTDAATAANQDTANGSLASIDGKLIAVDTDDVTVSSSALPTGASTASKQDTGNTSLASIDGKITAVNTGAVTVASSALPTGAATAAKQPGFGTAGTPSSDVTTVQGKSGMTPILTDGSAVTQPVSGTVTANAGTNLNTSALALETGGNLASVATNTTNIPNAIGTAASAVPSKLIQVGGSDGTNARAIKTNTSGQLDVRPLTSSDQVTIVPSGTQTVSGTVAASNFPSTVDTNSGSKSTSTMRVVLATDQPQLTNKLLVTPDANSSVNLSQVAGSSVATGHGTASGAVRVELPTDGTGLVNAAQSGTWTVQPGNTANTTAWLVTDTPATSGGLSVSSGSFGATATSIKSSAGQLYGWHLFNTTAAVAYVQFFNVATGSVTLGTTSPLFSIGIPASGGATVNFDKGIAFSTAITFACTTTRTGSTGATVDCNFFYK